MKCTVISGRSGSGKTGELLNRLSKKEDNLIITTDPSVVFIEMFMARNNIPGRCVGINSLPTILASDISMSPIKESTKEIEIAIIGKIINDYASSLKLFKENQYNNGLVNKIHSFITECKESNFSYNELKESSKKVSLDMELKLSDIIFIYEKYDEILKNSNFTTKDDLVLSVASKIRDKKISFKHVFVDVIDRYNKNTMELIKSLLFSCDDLTIAFNKTSKKAFDFDIHQEGINAMIDLYEFIDTIPSCQLENIETTSKKDIEDGLSIIEREMFNKDTETKSNAKNVVLHQSSNLYKEVDFMISQITELTKNGVKYSEIIVTSSSMERYINIIGSAMKKHNIPYYYFKNTTIDKTFLFQFIKNILDIKINGINSDNLLELCHLNFFNFKQSEIIAIDSFYNRFGKDLIMAIDNGKKYDNKNTLVVKNIIQKIMIPINNINDNCETTTEFLEDIYNYLEDINIKEIITNKAMVAEKEGYIHSSKEIINSWNSIISIFDNISSVFGNQKLEIDEIKDIFFKMAAEKTSNNSDLYHGQITLLDIDNAQNRKSKYLFVIGCNEGYMPKQVTPQIVTDREKIILNDISKKDLKLSSVYLNYKNAAIYNTLILPQERLYISWSKNDIDFKQMKYASIISNIVKTFEENIVKEEDFYNNDEEEKFINMLQNISLYKYKGIDTDIANKDFMYFMSNPVYNNRLRDALIQINKKESSFDLANPLDAYNEKEYFSVTRLERYNECPFKHFMEHAIHPERIKLFEETAADKGNYFHYIFKMFFDKQINGEIDINNLDISKYEEILEEIFNIVDDTHNESFLNSNDKNQYTSYKMKQKIKNSLWNAILQLKNSKFEVLSNEYVIGKNISLNIEINGEIYHIIGKVDRIDSFENYSRIIDYKSGATEYSYDKMKAGIQLQLPMYSKAIANESQISGMYYFKIKDFIKDADSPSEEQLKDYKLSGITLSDIDVLKANDISLDDGISSSIISADITQKGEISKKSKVLTEQEMSSLLEEAEAVSKNTISEILTGNTTAKPLIYKDFDACAYCKYKSLCNIDRTCKQNLRKLENDN